MRALVPKLHLHRADKARWLDRPVGCVQWPVVDSDHVACSKLVFDAAFTATLPNWPSKTGKAAKLVPIYYMDTLAGVNFVPDEFVDISDEIDLKIRMLECHRSQLDWMRTIMTALSPAPLIRRRRSR